MPFSGKTDDWRPPFAIFATGHRDAIPDSQLFAHPDPKRCLEVPGVRLVWDFLDLCLSKRLASHAPLILGRANWAPVDAAVQHYAIARKINYFPVNPSYPEWGRPAEFRRDLWLVARAHGVVWFGEDEDTDASPAKIAQILGIDCRVVSSLA